MNILTMVQNEEGKNDETKLTTVLENYKGLETKTKEMSEKITAFDSQKDEIIKKAKSSAIKIQEGGTLDFSSLVSDASIVSNKVSHTAPVVPYATFPWS
jgi:hypothetical protein